MHSQPDLFNIDTEIIMNQFVPHSSNILPGNTRIFFASLTGNSLGRLPDDLDLSDYSVPDEFIFLKASGGNPFCVTLDCQDRVTYMLQI